MKEFRNSKELYHYGVLGMKWGVRRGRADKAYQATEWGKRMEKEFANVPASSISEKDMSKGKEYAYMLKKS